MRSAVLLRPQWVAKGTVRCWTVKQPERVRRGGDMEEKKWRVKAWRFSPHLPDEQMALWSRVKTICRLQHMPGPPCFSLFLKAYLSYRSLIGGILETCILGIGNTRDQPLQVELSSRALPTMGGKRRWCPSLLPTPPIPSLSRWPCWVQLAFLTH